MIYKNESVHVGYYHNPARFGKECGPVPLRHDDGHLKFRKKLTRPQFQPFTSKLSETSSEQAGVCSSILGFSATAGQRAIDRKRL